MFSLFKKNNTPLVSPTVGVWYDEIQLVRDVLEEAGAITQGTIEMEENFPLTHHFDGGLYTRKVFMPKGSLVVSYIHKTSHPSFLLKGKVELWTDDGRHLMLEAPHITQTTAGSQRVLYMHEDTEWCCVYKTDATDVETAMKEIYAENWRELPNFVKRKNKELCRG